MLVAASPISVLAEWPTPIIFVGDDLGEELKFPAESIDRDFSWAANHPLVDAYRAAKTMPYDAPSPALAAVLYAAHPDDGYFKVVSGGLLTADAGQKDRIVQAYRQGVSAKPPEPRRGGRGA
jgi:hypothetical protein